MQSLLLSQNKIYETSKTNQHKIVIMNQEIDSLKKKIEFYQNMVKSQKQSIDNLNSITNKINNEIIDANRSSNEVNHVHNYDINTLLLAFEHNLNSNNKENLLGQFDLMKKDLIDNFQNKNKSIQNLLKKNKHLEEINSNLEKQIKKHEEENKKDKFCLNCHQTFSLNHDDV
jgi:hypothetical protein